MYRVLRRGSACETLAREFTFAMKTDRGRVRRDNEDTCAACPEVCAFVVCDGMGGAAAGEIASRLAADTFLAHIEATHQLRPPETTPASRLVKAVTAANHAVLQQARPNPRLHGMGTTLVSILLQDEPRDSPKAEDPPTVWLANVGDSRCYRMRGGELTQLTSDHSLVEEQFRAGHMTREEADASPMRNVITRAIGSQPGVEAELHSFATERGDLFLLATDGLTRELADAEIAGYLGQVPPGTEESVLAETCDRLIGEANARGGGDNISTLLLQIV